MTRTDRFLTGAALWVAAAVVALCPLTARAAKFNAYGQKHYTVETDHFRIHYHEGLEHLVKPVGAKFEQLYGIFSGTYGLVLPSKTDVVLQDGDVSNGLTFTNINFILLWTHDFDFNLRGSHEWFEDVITHEYAHQVSIWSSLKGPAWMPQVQVGYFTHPNERNRADALHVLPTDILPHWFTEGIAQYESSRHGADSWDSHRDMILRTLTLSNKLLSWDHTQVFAGKGDDMEKTYNHGFSLVRYIAETYGYDKILALIRESAKLGRADFDRSIEVVLGIPARQLYRDWKQSLEKRYRAQLGGIGKQVYGKKLNKDGYDNFWPRFSPDGKKVYFISNGDNDYGISKQLYSYSFADTIPVDKRVKPEVRIRGFYDIHAPSGRFSFVSAKSPKSVLPAREGGISSQDLFTDTLPAEKKRFRLIPKKTEKQVTERKGIFSAAFSPAGDRLACAHRVKDRFYLAVVDSNGRNFRVLYPDSTRAETAIHFIYSVDWAPDGRRIAISYMDKKDRKIGVYDTLDRTFSVLCNTDGDERDPSYSPDGNYLYFASDRTGIFNVYRYHFGGGALERVTNVSGGAFAPTVSGDGSKLVYAGYDESGYGIYLIDKITAAQTDTVDSALRARDPLPPFTTKVAFSQPRDYSRFPRQFLVLPTIFGEQAVTSDNDAFAGQTVLKAGGVFNVYDPFMWADKGTFLGGYFFMEPKRLLSFVNLDDGGINTEASYDLGLSAATQLLPLTLQADYALRGIAGKDWFFDEIEGAQVVLPYNVQLHNLTFLISHYIEGSKHDIGAAENGFVVHLLSGLNRYDVSLDLEEAYDAAVWTYNLSKGYRVGALGSFGTMAVDQRMNISPRGMAAKLQYDFWNQYSLKEENSFDTSAVQRELYDTYLFHQVSGRLLLGMTTPLHKHHDLHIDLRGTVVEIAKQDQKLPSYYLPVAWVPGYTYYYKDVKDKIVRVDSTGVPDTAKMNYDTVLVTGKAVVSGTVSYRFPLWPGLINKKLWIFYLERLYGGVNVSGGAGFERPSDLLDFERNDWVRSWGLETRLEAQTFSSIPLALKLRWDWGLDRELPLGGHRFTFAMGFDFDDWWTVHLPDYKMPGRLWGGIGPVSASLRP